MTDVIGPFLAATVRTATPLAFAALGELFVERAGMINVGLEGTITAGAFGAVVGASAGSVAAGYAGAALGGVVVASVFAMFVVHLRANQIITGTALTLLSAGITGTLYHWQFGAVGVALTLPTSPSVPLWGLSSIPMIGPALFAQPLGTYAMYLLVPTIAWWSLHTHAGLSLRAVGEYPPAAAAAGVRVPRYRTVAVLVNGIFGGIAGGTLVLDQAGTFAEGMSAGRGFIAIAIVVLGRWQPLGVALAALVFGAASALQFVFQAMGWHAPYQLFLVLPYLLTLAALAGARGQTRAPAALGKPF